MSTNHSARSIRSGRFSVSALTLLELLVAIVIIAVLAGILLPVASGPGTGTKGKTSAKNTLMQIVTAVKAYQTDYGAYPIAPNAHEANHPVDTTFDGTDNQKLFSILRAIETENPPVNTRRVVYFEGRDVKNANVPKDGFLPSTAMAVTQASGTGTIHPGALVDPWGNGYYIRCDTGYTDAVRNPYADDHTNADDPSGTTTGTIHLGVIAWTYGKDSSVGNGAKPGLNGSTGTGPNYTSGDDVLSWQ